MSSYVSVLLPLPLPEPFTYLLPESLAGKVKEGSRVIVPFGKKKHYTGIVVSAIAARPREDIEVKEIERLLDEYPIVKRPQRQLWEWVAEYYCCTPGEVMRAALPAGLKIESETFIVGAEDYEEDPSSPLTEREVVILQILDHENKRLSVADIEKKTGFGNVNAIISRLVDKGAVMVAEKLVERYRPQHIPSIRFIVGDGTDPANAVSAAFEAVKGAPKQEAALLTLLELQGVNRRNAPPRNVSRAELMERAGVTASILAALRDKGLVEFYKHEVNRFVYHGGPTQPLPSLTESQKTALKEIHRSWMDKDVTLLRGVTSSGKTEIYIHLINDVMSRGRQVLMLVPEIALTTQLTDRLQKVLGDKVIVYHSKFSDNERVDLWRKILKSKEPFVVVGARSSVFLPFENLGLIIVDEEHDPSYKQQDPAPRYNGRDTAMVLARMHGAKTLLGSATPAIDTYWKATEGKKFGLVELTERYGGARMPKMELIDMTRAGKRGEVSGAFAFTTINMAKKALEGGHQIILFLNRRGYAPVAICRQCGYIPKCQHCDVSLTYHKRLDKLVCHYCGSEYPLPLVCPSCKSPSVELAGYGTERIADDIDRCFPDVKVTRMDLDTTRNKAAYSNLISDFSKGESKILVGTQMVTKGLDFEGVSMVAAVNSDAMLSMPDFRAAERTFNMLQQVAGRAGRRSSEGTDEATVAIQTRTPGHPLFPFLLNHDYIGFYSHEIEERRAFLYPPFVRIVNIYVKHADPRLADEAAEAYAAELRKILGDHRISGPQEPPVGRIQTLYIRKIMLKLEPAISMRSLHQALDQIYASLRAIGRESFRRVVIYPDVDPV